MVNAPVDPRGLEAVYQWVTMIARGYLGKSLSQ
jgi:hypothetical protein